MSEDSKWKPNHGSIDRRPDLRVLVRRRDGHERRGRVRDYDWTLTGADHDIVEWLDLEA